MTTSASCIRKHLPLAAIFAISCLSTTGCSWFPESTFRLDNDSRFPRWTPQPSGLSHAEVSVTMDYYVYPWGRRAKFTMRDAKGQILKAIKGEMPCDEPFHLKDQSNGAKPVYPAYEAVTVDGTTEIIEHKKPEPLFSVTDDPAIWKQYREFGCN